YTQDFFEPGAQIKYGNKFVRKMEELIRKKLNHNGAMVNFGLITISEENAKEPVYKGIFGCD
ncbi:hypothetical protein, partial [Pararhodonellum marinum]|uniref:hypothetical protein n=1 Tax=Pararhodonellum marinum TaxID=2755358 RepID=UPI00188FA715